MGCCSGVVTQAYGQPDNPVLSRGKDSLAILTAAPFRGLPQPEAHGRRNLTTSLLRKRHLRRALSRYALTFQGYILSVNCQCRILIRVRRTTTRDSVLVSIFNRISMEDKMPTKLCPACNSSSDFSEKNGYYIFDCPKHGVFHISKLDGIFVKPSQYQADKLNKILNVKRASGYTGPIEVLPRPRLVELD